MRLLFIEDDRRLGPLVRRTLELDNQTVTLIDNGEAGLAAAQRADWDVIILDRRLPGLDGMAVLAALRSAGDHTPVLMLTAAADLESRVGGLEAGADDYLPKPFASSELLARIHALGRRGGAEDDLEHRLRSGGLEIDEIRRVARHGAATVELSSREFALLAFLFHNVGRTVGRDEILECVWGSSNDAYPNVVDLYVSYLRRKLKSIGVDAITTIRGVGYRFEAGS